MSYNVLVPILLCAHQFTCLTKHRQRSSKGPEQRMRDDLSYLPYYVEQKEQADRIPPTSAGGSRSKPQFARKFLMRHQLRCLGIELCFRAWYALAEVEPHEGSWSFDR